MKTFKDFVAEAASQPSTSSSEIPGLTVKMSTPGGMSTCSVKLVTPESPADKAYWEISNGGKVQGKLSPDQVKGIAPNEERKLTIDGKDFWFGGQAAGGKNKGTE